MKLYEYDIILCNTLLHNVTAIYFMDNQILIIICTIKNNNYKQILLVCKLSIL